MLRWHHRVSSVKRQLLQKQEPLRRSASSDVVRIELEE